MTTSWCSKILVKYGRVPLRIEIEQTQIESLRMAAEPLWGQRRNGGSSFSQNSRHEQNEELNRMKSKAKFLKNQDLELCDYKHKVCDKEVKWRQRSRNKWLKGDRNTKFFHEVASACWRSNKIMSSIGDSRWNQMKRYCQQSGGVLLSFFFFCFFQAKQRMYYRQDNAWGSQLQKELSSEPIKPTAQERIQTEKNKRNKRKQRPIPQAKPKTNKQGPQSRQASNPHRSRTSEQNELFEFNAHLKGSSQPKQNNNKKTEDQQQEQQQNGNNPR